ncbi:MAG: hypothetical protein M1826_003669 [Phylliscum demangeonii]|nr:MAG: hypothetical protein M1826_003669 [Phylliscum demangeonii]
MVGCAAGAWGAVLVPRASMPDGYREQPVVERNPVTGAGLLMTGGIGASALGGAYAAKLHLDQYQKTQEELKNTHNALTQAQKEHQSTREQLAAAHQDRQKAREELGKVVQDHQMTQEELLRARTKLGEVVDKDADCMETCMLQSIIRSNYNNRHTPAREYWYGMIADHPDTLWEGCRGSGNFLKIRTDPDVPDVHGCQLGKKDHKYNKPYCLTAQRFGKSEKSGIIREVKEALEVTAKKGAASLQGANKFVKTNLLSLERLGAHLHVPAVRVTAPEVLRAIHE